MYPNISRAPWFSAMPLSTIHSEICNLCDCVFIQKIAGLHLRVKSNLRVFWGVLFVCFKYCWDIFSALPFMIPAMFLNQFITVYLCIVLWMLPYRFLFSFFLWLNVNILSPASEVISHWWFQIRPTSFFIQSNMKYESEKRISTVASIESIHVIWFTGISNAALIFKVFEKIYDDICQF